LVLRAAPTCAVSRRLYKALSPPTRIQPSAPIDAFAPLLAASWPIRLHVVAAALALTLGVFQLARPKGGRLHHIVGYIWCGAMFVLAALSFDIHEIKQWAGFSLVHVLSIYVLCMLPLGLLAARAGRIERHKRIMQGMFFFGLLAAGAFTLAPGRIMHLVAFGAGP
jgi:uncharacterized membrane protein